MVVAERGGLRSDARSLAIAWSTSSPRRQRDVAIAVSSAAAPEPSAAPRDWGDNRLLRWVDRLLSR